MKVLKLEFIFFCGVAWNNKTVQITALNKFQLIRAFLDEIRWAQDIRDKKQIWKDNEKNIIQEFLTFPIIYSQEL